MVPQESFDEADVYEAGFSDGFSDGRTVRDKLVLTFVAIAFVVGVAFGFGLGQVFGWL